MNQHPYLRAFMAGIFVPTLVILLACVAFTVARYVCDVPVPIERVIVFPLTIVPNLWGVWNILYVAALGLLHAVYTITGFDASAHTSEETRNAQREVPKGMIRSVWWSALFGYFMVCAMVLALPDQTDASGTVTDGVAAGAKQGWASFNWLIQTSAMPFVLKALIIIGIVVSNFLCALAGLTSCSRMLYAFARDGGLPMSDVLKQVSPVHRTPGAAIWVGGVLSIDPPKPMTSRTTSGASYSA